MKTTGGVGHTLSPQIVIRDHVRILCSMFIVVFHVSESAMSRMNLELWKILGRLFSPGTWNFKVVDLKRYGRGGLEVIV